MSQSSTFAMKLGLSPYVLWVAQSAGAVEYIDCISADS